MQQDALGTVYHVQVVVAETDHDINVGEVVVTEEDRAEGDAGRLLEAVLGFDYRAVLEVERESGYGLGSATSRPRVEVR